MKNQNKKFNVIYFILFAIIDFFTLAFGTATFVSGIFTLISKQYSGGRDIAATGALLVVCFFLIRLWRKEYRERNTED